MQEHFGCRPQHIRAIIGPGISQKNYQVDTDTARNFDARHCLPDSPGHYLLDVGGAIVQQLLDSGLKQEHIETDRRCTFENDTLFYSYRRDGKRSGRMMAVLGLTGA